MHGQIPFAIAISGNDGIISATSPDRETEISTAEVSQVKTI
uniref:Uncharacterized protein n=1 Tax=Rhizophora mucronata TaxID=61149 RepID=A0A2P2P0I1_RHIMU